MEFSWAQKLGAEAVGTALLLAIVIGSGVMGDRLSPDDGVALLGNTLSTGAGLVVLIMMFGVISGAHFNPAVTAAFWAKGDISTRLALAYVVVQIVGALIGVWIAHLMFDLPIMQVSIKGRDGIGQISGEAVATFALVLTILQLVRHRPDAVPYAVGLIITAGYWFTSSTSFANPAVTIARVWSDTFAGIAPGSAPFFILGQGLGTAAAFLMHTALAPKGPPIVDQ
ncbi:MIP family protein [Parvularcula bermudensis HTCC2503]|uniref:MIP family protein n=1 Tax=Parvularcula bermudensis (strain ATCC BAA-594 / HTCC2503 / KCTC 12087) TaxID=314260 RepID=E0TFB4_PARBH|nr:MIP/aquaporin family protein [Parvularcula bermudensis]ADM09032.1 MIP family protein [Parvularcula bermudensis HTCC2503]